MVKTKSLLELVNYNLDESEEEELSEIKRDLISSFERYNQGLGSFEKRLLAKTIASKIKQGEQLTDIKKLVESENTLGLFSVHFRVPFYQEFNLASIQDTVLNTTPDLDFAAKAKIVQMVGDVIEREGNVQALFNDLNDGLAGKSPEEQREFISAEHEQMLAEDSSVLTVLPEVRKSQGIFLAEQVFMPVMRESSPVMSRSSSMESFGASEHGVALSAQPSTPSVAAEEGTGFSRQSSADFYQEPVQFLQEMPEKQRHALAERAAEAVNRLAQVKENGKGKYSMSEDDPKDTVEITKDEDGLYTITPGEKFTGVIKMKREVAEGESPSFDVIEFENGVMVSGVEGTRGKSKIANLEELQQSMFAQHDTVPLFVFNGVERQQSAYTSYVARMEEGLNATPSARRENLAEERVEIQDAESSLHIERKREMVALKETLRKEVSSHLEEVKKTGVRGTLGRTYHEEKAALVDEVAETVLGVFTARGALDHGRVERYEKEIMASVREAMQEQKDGLQAILAQEESKDNPAHVRREYMRQKLENDIASVVWKDCQDMVVREELRAAMVEQMSSRIKSVGGYTVYRDELIANVVDQAMGQLPEMTVKTIEENKAKLLKDFEKATKFHDAAVKGFLAENAVFWRDAVSEVRGHQDRSVMEKVGDDVAQYTALETDGRKADAVSHLMKEVRATLVDSAKGGFKAATWMGREWHDQQLNAIVDQMVSDMAQRLSDNNDITTEMLYNNRDGIMQAVKTQVTENAESVKEFLDKEENQTLKLDDIKGRWKTEGAEVIDSMVESVTATLKENQAIAAERSKALSNLEQEMFEEAKKTIPAIQKAHYIRRLNSPDYHQERDQMAILVAKQAVEYLGEDEISAGVIKRDHDAIMEKFRTSLAEHGTEIQGRLQAVEDEKEYSGGMSGSAVAREVLEHRTGEERDVDIAADVAAKFKHSAEEIVRAESAKMKAKRAMPKLSLGSVVDAKHGHVSAPSTPRSGHSSTSRSVN